MTFSHASPMLQQRPVLQRPLQAARWAPLTWLGHHRPLLTLRLNGADHGVRFASPDPRLYGSIQTGLRYMALSGGVAGSVSERAFASASLLFDQVDRPLHKYQRVHALLGELLQLALDALPAQTQPLGCIPSISVTQGEYRQLVVRLRVAGGGARSPLADALARRLRLPLVRLIEPAARPRLVLGVCSTQEVGVRCALALADAAGQRLPSNDNAAPRPLDTNAPSTLSHLPEQAERDNQITFSAIAAVAADLGLANNDLSQAWRAHARRWGSTEPLVNWYRDGAELVGELAAPLPHPYAQNHAEAALRAAAIGLAVCAGRVRESFLARGIQLHLAEHSLPHDATDVPTAAAARALLDTLRAARTRKAS